MNRRSSAASTPIATSGVTPQFSSQDWQRLKRVRAIATLLDNAIELPIVRYRVGLDPVIGLLPIGGDLVSFLLSVYLVWESARLGTPPALLTRMTVNIALETLAGVVPALGDLVDVAWKANAQNLQLLEAHLHAPDRGPGRVSKRFVLLLIGGLLLLTIATASLSLWLLQLAWRTLVGA